MFLIAQALHLLSFKTKRANPKGSLFFMFKSREGSIKIKINSTIKSFLIQFQKVSFVVVEN